MGLISCQRTATHNIFDCIDGDLARDPAVFSRDILAFCKRVELLIAAQEEVGFGGFHCWVCLKEVQLHPEEPTGRWVSFEVRVCIDRASGEGRTTRFFFDCDFQIIGDMAVHVAARGVEANLRWCMDLLLECWRDAFSGVDGLDFTPVLANTRMWIFGQSDRLYGYDATGAIVLKNEKLPDPEVNYTDIRYLTGKWEEDWSEEDAEFDRLMAEAEAEKKLHDQAEESAGPEKGA